MKTRWTVFERLGAIRALCEEHDLERLCGVVRATELLVEETITSFEAMGLDEEYVEAYIAEWRKQHIGEG